MIGYNGSDCGSTVLWFVCGCPFFLDSLIFITIVLFFLPLVRLRFSAV